MTSLIDIKKNQQVNSAKHVNPPLIEQSQSTTNTEQEATIKTQTQQHDSKHHHHHHHQQQQQHGSKHQHESSHQHISKQHSHPEPTIVHKTPIKNRSSHQSTKPPFFLGTTPTTYAINAILQQKRSINKFQPQETLTSLTRKNYNTDVKHPKEENVLKRVIALLDEERLTLVQYAKDITLMKLKVFKPSKLAKSSVEVLYAEFSTEIAPNHQKLLELKSRIRRITAQPALERIIQKEFDYFFTVLISNIGIYRKSSSNQFIAKFVTLVNIIV